jgi:5-methylthioadenosine/S-adenosylhomocysteine deaminase
LTRALRFRDEFRGHPSIASAFAPHSPCAIPDAAFHRIATLADELDAGILMPLHESQAAIAESVKHHGLRPIERLHALGLLTPALTAVHMSHVDAADLALAERSGIAITLCPAANLRAGEGVPPIAQWTAAGLRLSLGSGIAAPTISPNLWAELKWLALLGHAPRAQTAAWTPWSALAVATRGGAATLGLDAEIGTLEHGKWADLCCIDLRGPAMQWASLGSPHAALTQWVLNGDRDVVSDVWVAGRHLLNGGDFTRIDWPHLAARLRATTDRSSMGEAHADIG